jgi:hypothetical protein
VPRYRILTEDDEDLGPFHTAEPSWSEGDRIFRGPEKDLVVVRVVPAEEGADIDGYLVVRPAP